MLPPKILDSFAGQERACISLGSPFTARLCRVLPSLLDPSTATGRRIADWSGDPAADALALRLCGALHALVLAGTDKELEAVYPPHASDDGAFRREVSAALERNDTALAGWLDQPPQTNETARAGMILPGLLLIARETGLPLDVNEIGTSAGLNLHFDRFHYDYAGQTWGDPASPARLSPEVRGAPPPLDGELRITARAGNDIVPIDIGDPAQRLRLRSYIWADQTARLERLDAAMSLALRQPPALDRGDAADFARQRLAARVPGSAFILFHTIMWQYMPEASRQGVAAALARAGATAGSPVAHLRMEPVRQKAPYATLSLTMWPGGGTRELARCDYHGRWIEWTG